RRGLVAGRRRRLVRRVVAAAATPLRTVLGERGEEGPQVGRELRRCLHGREVQPPLELRPVGIGRGGHQLTYGRIRTEDGESLWYGGIRAPVRRMRLLVQGVG